MRTSRNKSLGARLTKQGLLVSSRKTSSSSPNSKSNSLRCSGVSRLELFTSQRRTSVLRGLLGGLLAADYSTARNALSGLCKCDGSMVKKFKTSKKKHGGSTLRGAKAPLKIMDSLPEDILRNVVKTLNPEMLCRLSCVSKTMRVVADDDEFWNDKTGYTKDDTRDIVARAERALINSACMRSETIDKLTAAKKHLREEAEKRIVCSMHNTAHGSLACYSGPWGHSHQRSIVLTDWMNSPFLREERLYLELFESEIFVRRGTFDHDTFRLRNIRSVLRK